jgi:hypothetical protein
MTAFGSPTGAIEIGGRGEFDGDDVRRVRRPRSRALSPAIAMRAWDTIVGPRRRRSRHREQLRRHQEQRDHARGSRIERRRAVLARAYPRKDGGERSTPTSA